MRRPNNKKTETRTITTDELSNVVGGDLWLEFGKLYHTVRDALSPDCPNPGEWKSYQTNAVVGVRG